MPASATSMHAASGNLEEWWSYWVRRRGGRWAVGGGWWEMGGWVGGRGTGRWEGINGWLANNFCLGVGTHTESITCK